MPETASDRTNIGQYEIAVMRNGRCLAARDGWIIPRIDPVKRETDLEWWDVYDGSLESGPQRESGLRLLHEHLHFLGVPKIDWKTLIEVWTRHSEKVRAVSWIGGTPFCLKPLHISQFAELCAEVLSGESTD